MAENLRKLLLYFREPDAYWRLSAPEAPCQVGTGALRRYPLDFIPFLTSGHYAQFDSQGLPRCRGERGAGLIHNYTTLSSFALAYWDRYLSSGSETDRERVLCVADYIMSTADRSDPADVRLARSGPAQDTWVACRRWCRERL